MKLAVGLGGPLSQLPAAARETERAGFESAWVTELEHSAFVGAGAALAATTTLRVGTAIALAFPRSPTITAMEAADLDELSGGRFLLGLGSQVRRVMEDRFGVPYDHPAARLAEYAAAVRTVWGAARGESATHEGEFYRVTMPRFHGTVRPERHDPPILFAAVGEVMARTAGRVADGLIGHPLASARYLAEIVAPAAAVGAERSGRPADACPISATVLVSLDPADPDRARREARLQLAFYATTPNYRGILALHGREGLGRELRRAFVGSDRAAFAALVDDELLDAIAIAGRPDEARDRLTAWSSSGAIERAILAPPWYGIDERRARDLSAALVGTFGG